MTAAATAPGVSAPVTMLDDHALDRLRREHDWLTERALDESWIIGNPDLDGLLCLALIRSVAPNCRIAGFYTGERLLLTTEARDEVRRIGNDVFRARTVAIESDFYLFRSVGQHFTLAESARPHLNPNGLRGFGRGNWSQTFRRKYPFNTLVFLWRWFARSLPCGQARANAVRALFYPDGVLLKVVNQYRDNCGDWLKWLGLGVSLDELIALAAADDAIQLARCLYKSFDNTQMQLVFGQTAASNPIFIGNWDTVEPWLDWFCDALALPSLALPSGYVLHGAFHQNRIQQPQHELRWLSDDGRCFKNEEIVSDALVMLSTWSVTMRRRMNLTGATIGLPRGLAAEPAQWVERLSLATPCREPVGPCRRCCSRRQDHADT